MGNRSLTLAYLPAPAPGVTQPAQPSLTLCHLQAASKPQNSLALTRSLSYSGACFHPQSSKRWHCSPKHRVSPSPLASHPNSHPAYSLSTLPITPCHNGVCVTPCSVFPRPPTPPYSPTSHSANLCSALPSSQHFLSISSGQGTKLGLEGSNPVLLEALPATTIPDVTLPSHSGWLFLIEHSL